jgi:methylmalonyl-CoA epimerase
MAKEIHHVGLAVKDVQTVADLWKEILGAELIEDYSMETPDFLSRMMRVGKGLFELLEPRGEDGLIERYINTRGEGIHHVSIQVDNLDEVLEACREKGIALIGNRFIHPKGTHGVLVELLDSKSG